MEVHFVVASQFKLVLNLFEQICTKTVLTLSTWYNRYFVYAVNCTLKRFILLMSFHVYIQFPFVPKSLLTFYAFNSFQNWMMFLVIFKFLPSLLYSEHTSHKRVYLQREPMNAFSNVICQKCFPANSTCIDSFPFKFPNVLICVDNSFWTYTLCDTLHIQ